MGRYPDPVAIRQAHGDTRKIGERKLAALSESTPQPATGEPTQPPGMSARAKREWLRVVAELLAVPRLLTRINGDALAAYCEDMVHLRVLRKEQRKVGDVIEGPAGPTMNPLLKQIDILEQRCMAHRREFGMTPSAMARLRVSPEDQTLVKSGSTLNGNWKAS